MVDEAKTEIVIGREFPKKVIPLIHTAKKTILIIVYDWGWYPNEIGEQIQIFNQAIVRANRRSVNVRALVNKRLIKEVLRRTGVDATKIESTKLLHTKLMIIDNEILILGSHNYTKNAFNINFEMSVILRDKDAAEKATNYFNTISL